MRRLTAPSSNGKRADSDSVNQGSNPCGASTFRPIGFSTGAPPPREAEMDEAKDVREPGEAPLAEGDLEERKFYRAEQEAGFAESSPTDTPQTRHPAYRLAFRDTDFLLRDELRPVRFQLELLKPSMLLDEARV